MPADYLKVNTVFAAHDAGLRTASADKHPAYAILAGHGGSSIDDLFTPEVDSNPAGGKDAASSTDDNALTQRYDTFKVDAIANEIAGKDHSGSKQVGTPSVFGMNFQSVSTAEKLAESGGQPGGYSPDGQAPGPVLASALGFVDTQIGRMVSALDAAGIADTTTIIVSAKHGQSRVNPDTLTRIDDGRIIDAINAEWATTHPDVTDLVVHSVNDDAMIMWLADRSPAAAAFVADRLRATAGEGTDIAGTPKPFTAAGTDRIYAGADAATFFGAAPGDPRVPDLYASTQPGTVYTSGAEEDRRARRHHPGPAQRPADRGRVRYQPSPGSLAGRDRADRTDHPESPASRSAEAPRRRRRTHRTTAGCVGKHATPASIRIPDSHRATSVGATPTRAQIHLRRRTART